MASSARILGLAKLHKKLARMSQGAKDEIQKALEAAADEIVDMAKRLAPVDQGELRDSIGWTWGKAPKGAITLGKVAEASLAGDLTITVFAGNSQAYYARFVEFGTQKMPAQPYFYPAYRATKKRAKSRVRRSLTKAAKAVASS